MASGKGQGSRSSSTAWWRRRAASPSGEVAPRDGRAGANWPRTGAGRGLGRGFQGEGSYRAGRSRHSQVPGVTPGRGVTRVARPGFAKDRGGGGVVTRVPFQGQLSIGLLEFVLAGVAPHPQRLVVTLHRPAGRAAGAGARGVAGTRARVEGVVMASMVLSCGGSRALAPGQPASAAAVPGDGGARRGQAARAAARGCAEGAAPADAAPHGTGEGSKPEKAAWEGGGTAAGRRGGLGGREVGLRREEAGLRREEAGPRREEAGPRGVSL